MAISSSGIGSGLDVNSLVSQLVAAERAPGDARIAKAEAATRADISAFGALRSAFAGLETALKKFEGTGSTMARKATVGADAGFSASAGAKAATGSYQITVERLAQAHKLQSAPQAATTQVGHGTLTITTGSADPIVVTVADGKGTLADIRDAINAKAGNNGVSASVVKGDAGDVLVLSATRAGTANAIAVSQSGGDGGLAALTTMTSRPSAQDAVVAIDGVTRTASTNRIDDAIEGVSLDLSRADAGKTFSLDITGDGAALKTSAQGLVTAYNAALAAIRTQTAYNPTTRTSAALAGDALPRAMATALRNAIGTGAAELSALGIKGSKDGSLSLDAAAFDRALAADPGALAKAFADDAPLGKALRAAVTGYTATGGAIEGRTTAANQQMTRLARERDTHEMRIASIESTYRKQFTALDSLMTRMSSTSSYLAQQLAAL